MADIAILVAEEYERRVKISRKAAAAASASASADLAMEINWVSFISESVKNSNLEIPKWVLEPKTQIAVAASNGFFSA